MITVSGTLISPTNQPIGSAKIRATAMNMDRRYLTFKIFN